jgi:integrase
VPREPDLGPGNHGRKVETFNQTLQRARRVAAEMQIDTTGARLPDLRPHDLRRTNASWQRNTGASLPTIGESLGHKTAAATEIYVHMTLDPVRESMERAADAMLAAAGRRPQANVIPFTRPKRTP